MTFTLVSEAKLFLKSVKKSSKKKKVALPKYIITISDCCFQLLSGGKDVEGISDELRFRRGAIATKPGETKMQTVHKSRESLFTVRRETKLHSKHLYTKLGH